MDAATPRALEEDFQRRSPERLRRGPPLRRPLVSRERITLPEFLAKQRDVRARPAAASGAAAKKAQAPSAGLSEELARRRRLHPRLRWSRLACPTGKGQGPFSGTGIAVQDTRVSSSSDDRSLADDRQHPEDTFVEETIIGPGSIFYSGKELFVEELILPLLLTRRLHDPEQQESAALQSTGEGGPSNRPVLLPRLRPRAEAAAGTVATVCLCKSSNGDTSQDRKYALRQAPVSHLSASQDAPGQSSSQTAEARLRKMRRLGDSSRYLDFQSWSLADDYVQTLLREATLHILVHMNLSDNRLTSASIETMLDIIGKGGLPMLRSLQLARNRLGPAGGSALARLLHEARPPLRELDISGNMVGDKACAQLCEVLLKCTRLAGLGLAQNNLGRDGMCGSAIGRLLGNLGELTMLDLHWNHLHGADAAALFDGLMANSWGVGGRLRRLDISWNSLGLRCAEATSASSSAPQPDFGELELQDGSPRIALHELGSPQRLQGFLQAPSCACKVCAGCARMAQSLAAFLRDSQELFHLDLSFNDLGPSECAVLAAALRNNHTLFGVHISGNAATVDEHGFIIPASPETKAMLEKRLALADDLSQSIPPSARSNPRGGASVSPSVQSITGKRIGRSAFSEQDLAAEREWDRARSQVQQPVDFGTASSGAVMRTARCCWICENWVEQVVSYTPGWSGPETSADEVEEAWAFFGSDGFTCPTRLHRVEEPYDPQAFVECPAASDEEADRPSDASRPRAPCRTASGRVVRWTGRRMLPPSSVAVQVVFQVNQCLVTAGDLPIQSVRPRASIALQRPAAGLGEGSEEDLGPVVEQIGRANAMSVSKPIPAQRLVVMEDPARRGKLQATPRRVPE